MNSWRADRAYGRIVGLILAVAGLSVSPVGTGSAAQDGATAQRIFQLAESLELEGRLGEAVREYQVLVDQFPGSDLAGEALFRIAVDAWSRRELEDARSTTATLMERHPGSHGAAGGMVLDATMHLAMAEDEAGVEDAVTILRRLPALYGPGSRGHRQWGPLAALMRGDLALLEGSADEALGAYMSAVDGAASSYRAALARLGMAWALLLEQHWLAAAQLLQQVIDTATEDAREPPAAPTLDEVLAADVAGTPLLAAGVSRLLSRAPHAAHAEARRLATLIHRHAIAPGLGMPRWTRARRLNFPSRELRDPVGIAVSAEGELIVVDEGARFGALFDADGSPLARLDVERGRRPWFDPDGGAHVAVERAVVMPSSGQRLTFGEPQAGRSRPLEKIVAGLRDHFGFWYLVDEDRRAVLRFTRDRAYVGHLAAPGNPQPVDAAADRRGYLYVLDRAERSVLRYEPGGAAAPTRLIRGDWRRPEALAVDDLGQIYVLDRDERRLELYDAAGTRLQAIGPALAGGVELRSPRDVAVDGAGRLFIADRNLAAIVVLE